MPLFLNSKTTRRKFIQTTLAAAGTLAVQSIRPTSARAADRTRWAFLSDVHVPRDPSNEYRGFHPYANMKKAVGEVVSAKPEGALITGDLARLEGFTGDYASLKTLTGPLVEQMPLCMALGNHDHRGNFWNAFKDHPGAQKVSRKHVQVIETGPVRLIVLDSNLATNITPGQLGKAQREWLRSFLNAAAKKPTLLFFHHTLGDEDGSLVDVERLFPIIVPQNQVKAIVFGHSHVYDYHKLFDIHLINLPAVAYNFSDTVPIGWIEAELTAGGGAFTLHTIGGNQEKNGETTEIQWRS